MSGFLFWDTFLSCDSGAFEMIERKALVQFPVFRL